MNPNNNAFARKILSQKTTAWTLLAEVLKLGEDLNEVVASFEEETRKDLEGSPTFRSFEAAAAVATLALLNGEPVAPHIGRLLYWNVYLYMTPDKVRSLTAAVADELA